MKRRDNESINVRLEYNINLNSTLSDTDLIIPLVVIIPQNE